MVTATDAQISHFISSAEALGLSLSKRQLALFMRFYELLLDWNSRMNLTTITDFDEAVSKHFIDSLSLVRAAEYVSLQDSLSVLDLGTGAGFPGIPLKIMFPQLRITLLDSLQKRVAFLQAVIDELQFNSVSAAGICAVHGRAEELALQQAYRERFDLCVSRAVAKLPTLSEYCLPFVRLDGYFISYKADAASEWQQAQKAIALLGGKTEAAISLTLPETEIQRTLFVIKKEKPTPKKFPRKAGTPSKNPLS